MSWFTDLAGKAELLLEKVDNTAANVLQTDDKVDPRDVYPGQEPQQIVEDVGSAGYEPRLSRTASEGTLLSKSHIITIIHVYHLNLCSLIMN